MFWPSHGGRGFSAQFARSSHKRVQTMETLREGVRTRMQKPHDTRRVETILSIDGQPCAGKVNLVPGTCEKKLSRKCLFSSGRQNPQFFFLCPARGTGSGFREASGSIFAPCLLVRQRVSNPSAVRTFPQQSYLRTSGTFFFPELFPLQSYWSLSCDHD